jgi:hypothetical protein
MPRIFEAYAQSVAHATRNVKALTEAHKELGTVLLQNGRAASDLARNSNPGTISGGAGGGGGGGSFLPVAEEGVRLLNELVGLARGDAAYASIRGHG